ncbi:hydrolase 1, exosortase A system-associated [Nitrosovibrio sp. Nv6]|uniref:hydrolase 1, exosortase A system-associated n=1 Tax=Nitrosovibrio sp. Nv6 TaxID=1855340 RepID=UPI0008CE5FED|nr:hydrolase 1, exosortase A system-associated [Nitrosovibrio sp. Nv6]SEP35935.1 exosortase A system-associated hydrolase 1 [Nitrosovibrio sp. Nv6]
MMNFDERGVVFRCEQDWLYGILSLPEHYTSKGVLIVVGGPQYRVGSHRQFTLLARHLAAHGIPVLRFDFRGMGDSEGGARTFEDVEEDLSCAIEKFLAEVPLLHEVVILGLCDAASAALFYAYQDRRVTGLVLLNPWVRTDQGSAKVYLKHYYTTRIFQPEFWSKIWRGNFDYVAAAQSLFRTIHATLTGREKAGNRFKENAADKFCSSVPLPERMYHALSRFKGEVLLIISGRDLTAQEFSDLVQDSPEWQKLLASPQVSRLNLLEANHTFSRREWRDQVAVWTTEWIQGETISGNM